MYTDTCQSSTNGADTGRKQSPVTTAPNVSIRPGSPERSAILREHGVAWILVVEDDDMLREGLTELLEENGYTVHAVRNGQEALDHLAMVPLRPRLILSDIKMPTMDGWELLNRLRASDFAAIPLVMMTAHPVRVAAPGVLILTKPFELDALLAAVEQACGPPLIRYGE